VEKKESMSIAPRTDSTMAVLSTPAEAQAIVEKLQMADL
jgi:hypothetical protein